MTLIGFLSHATDWGRYLREAIAAGTASELDPDLSLDAALSKLQVDLATTPHEQPFAEAVLALLETGTEHEKQQLMMCGLDGAHDVGPRVATLAADWRGDTSLAPLVGRLLLRGVTAVPCDAAIRKALEAHAAIDAEHAKRALHAAVPFDIEWVAAHLTYLDAAVDPDGAELFHLAFRTREEDVPILLAGIAGAGADYVRRFLSATTTSEWALPHVLARLRPHLAANQAFNNNGAATSLARDLPSRS